MRRRKKKLSGKVFWLALLASVFLHVVIGLPAGAWMVKYLSWRPKEGPRAVRVVTVSPDQWSRNRQLRRPRKATRAVSPARKPPDKPKPKEAEKPKPKEEKLSGQVVEIAPTEDDSPNPEARFLSKQNTRVERESVARYEERDRTKKRVTSRLQERAAEPRRDKTIKNPVLDVKGDELEGKRGGGDGKGTDKGEFVLELPSLRRREKVKLRLTDLPGARQSERRGQEELLGKGKRFRLEMGGPGEGDETGGSKGKTDGAEKRALPSLEQLRPTIGTIARISGSPSNDYIENVPEGDATFLNSKEFKYATFFYRVKDSVGSLWYDMVSRELRRRDPTGNIYGPRDRATLLTVRIDMDGRLADVVVANSSGVQFLDEVAVQAFKRAEPFPNPPSAMADEDGYIKFNFQFVMLRSRGPLNLFNFR